MLPTPYGIIDLNNAQERVHPRVRREDSDSIRSGGIPMPLPAACLGRRRESNTALKMPR
jgi:hypothetical protein